MVDVTAVFSLVSGLGGAAIGATAAIYGPALLDRHRHRDQVADRSHDSVATATAAAHAWQRMVVRRIQELRAERPVELAAFDQETETAMDAVTKAIADLARPEIMVEAAPGGTVGRIPPPEPDPPVLTRMWSVITDLRWMVLRQTTDIAQDTVEVTLHQRLAGLEDEAVHARRAMVALLEDLNRRRTSVQLPPSFAQSKPPD